MLPSPISEGDPPLPGPRLKAGEEPPGRDSRPSPLPGPRLKAGEEPPGRDSRPFPTAFVQVHGHIRDTCPAQGGDKSLVLRYICEQVRG